MSNKKILFAAAVALVFGASSCRKFMDVNNNPNISQTATVQTLLPAAELYIGSSVGVDFQIAGSIWGQYWTQTPTASQYVSFEQFAPGQDGFSYAWRDLYAGAENFYQLYNLADSQQKPQYKAIALLMQAYTFQLITDAWGDVPFKQALKGQYINGHVVNPKYDSQRVVYRGILAYIDSANKLMAIGGVTPGADDIIYGGKMAKWAKFSNTLKLKIYLRMAYIDPIGARAGIDALYNTAPSFIGDGDDAKIAYGSSAANKNPLYAETNSTQLAGIQNLAGSSTVIDSMNNNDDYRAWIFYNPTGNGPIGLTQGSYQTSAPAGTYSIPSAYVGGDASSPNSANSANAPVNLLTSWESNFMQAEVAARGWGTPAGTDVAYFYAGIRSSFLYYNTAFMNELGISADSAYSIYVNGDGPGGIAPGYWTQYPTASSVDDKLRFIITQKWFAMCGNQGFEGWTEWRRTGYPDFLIHPVSSLIGSQLPVRFLYPTSESTVNSNFPGLAPVTKKVWWDTF